MFTIYDYKLADIGYFINLDKSTDRLENVDRQIGHFRINGLERFPALTNQHIPQSSATDSHLAVFDLCLKNNFETIAVFEDDFQFSDQLMFMPGYSINLYEYLSTIYDEIINSDWDIFFLGFNPRKKCIPVSKNIARVFKSTGAWGYLIKKRAYTYLLNITNYGRDRLAIDDLLPYMTYNNFNCYASTVPICNHGINFISTLQPSLGPVNYSDWILGNYHKNLWNSVITRKMTSDEIISKIYTESDIARASIIRINNFDGNIQKLETFEYTNKEYRQCLLELNGVYNNDIGYYMNIESPNLFHLKQTIDTLQFRPKNYIDIEL
jgi:GR25 family glycosyltransferase involved in LPS biosynthesis